MSLLLLIPKPPETIDINLLLTCEPCRLCTLATLLFFLLTRAISKSDCGSLPLLESPLQFSFQRELGWLNSLSCHHMSSVVLHFCSAPLSRFSSLLRGLVLVNFSAVCQTCDLQAKSSRAQHACHRPTTRASWHLGFELSDPKKDTEPRTRKPTVAVELHWIDPWRT